jgi:molybdopterin converting factor small subunit
LAEITVRYYASARAASGVAHEPLNAVTVADAVEAIGARHGARMTAILRASSLLLDGMHVADLSTQLAGASELDVLPPFAGG